MPTFIGIDLAWQSDKNHSGAAVLYGDRSGVTLRTIATGLKSLRSTEEFILANAEANTVIAIDAPLVIKNLNGQRPCETEISRRFSAADASAHTSNLRRFPNASSIRLTNNLASQGFRQCPDPHMQCLPGKWFFEVYPHPAHVVLFKRKKIIKYKKGPVASRRHGLMEFRRSLEHFLSHAEPPLKSSDELQAFLQKPLESLCGNALKEYEDTLDAVFCAYLAAYFWVWSYDRNEMIGNPETGYIINPRA